MAGTMLKHFLGSKSKVPAKKSPYDDTKGLLRVFRQAFKSVQVQGLWKWSRDCFFFGNLALACEHSQEFLRIMEIIDHELGLGLESNTQKGTRHS